MIPFEIRTLNIGHTEQRRVQRFLVEIVRHRGTVGAWSDGDSLPLLLAIYIQSVHTKRVIRNMYATPPSLFVPSTPL